MNSEEYEEYVEYVEELPMINPTEKIIALSEINEGELHKEWMEYNNLVFNLGEDEVPGYKAYQNLHNPAIHTSIDTYSKALAEMLGIGGKFQFTSMVMRETDEGTEKAFLMIQKDLDGLYRLLFEKEGDIHINKVPLRTILDRFFIFLWGSGDILMPTHPYGSGNSMASAMEHLYKDSPLMDDLKKLLKSEKYFSYHRKAGWGTALLRVMSMTSWREADDIIEEDLLEMMEAFLIHKKVKSYEGSMRTALSVLELIRYYLIDRGRKDIAYPSVVKATYRTKGSKRAIPLEKRLDAWTEHPVESIREFAKSAQEYVLLLHEQGISLGSIDRKLKILEVLFERFASMSTTRQNLLLDRDWLEDNFTPDSEQGLIALVKEKSSSESAFYYNLNVVTALMDYMGLFTAKMRKNIPVQPKKVKRRAYRQAMPKEMVQHIVEILKERPPHMPVRWDPKRADISWWEHEVYPVFPLMMLFGYYVPMRGQQVRWLCRDKSFVLSRDKKSIETIVINTDKNTRREYLQEIPNVWKDLNIFIPFIEWHKEYYPMLKHVPYKLDDRTPWEDVMPLMVTPQSPYPVSHTMHMEYHKRVLCQYQIEKNLEAQKSGDTPVVIAWRTDGEPFFNSIEELNNTPRKIFSSVKVAYDIHSLRVTGATRYLESGLGINTVMGLTGHTSPETLIRIYINLTRKEKEDTMRSAVDQIYFGGKETLLENTNSLIRGELTVAYQEGKEHVVHALEENKLFSLYRKPLEEARDSRDLYSGEEIASQIHPSQWQPMIHGICPGVVCPTGRENRCSLCPHLITGKLFIEGVAHQTNLLFARFQRLSLESKKERGEKKYFHSGKGEELEILLEELLGWQEILSKIDDTIEGDLVKKADKSKGTNLVVSNNSRSSVVRAEQASTELAYLKNAYDVQQLGVEHDYFGLKLLTIKAVEIASKMGDNKKVQELIEDETKVIDMLMGFYKKGITDTQNVDSFLKEVKNIDYSKKNI